MKNCLSSLPCFILFIFSSSDVGSLINASVSEVRFEYNNNSTICVQYVRILLKPALIFRIFFLLRTEDMTCLSADVYMVSILYLCSARAFKRCYPVSLVSFLFDFFCLRCFSRPKSRLCNHCPLVTYCHILLGLLFSCCAFSAFCKSLK